jgi:AraC-like DNA-binding protein
VIIIGKKQCSSLSPPCIQEDVNDCVSNIVNFPKHLTDNTVETRTFSFTLVWFFNHTYSIFPYEKPSWRVKFETPARRFSNIYYMPIARRFLVAADRAFITKPAQDMTLTLNLPALLYMVAMVLGTIISLICWIYPPNYSTANRWLGASIFSLTFALFVLFFSESGLIYYAPHLFQTSFIATLLYAPFSFFFVRAVVLGTPFTWRDFIHALPPILFLIDYSVVYALPASEKLNYILSQHSFAYIYRQGWLIPMNVHLPIRFILFLVYFGLQFRMTLISTSPEKRRILHYLMAQLILVFYYTIYQLTDDPFALRFVTTVISAYIVLIAMALLFHPNFLYSYRDLTPARIVGGIMKLPFTVDDGYQQKRIEHATERLELYMSSDLPFLHHGYSIRDLSNAMQMPTHQLSTILNQHLQMSFNEYLNKHRINYCLDRIMKGAAEALTLEALAFECGFNNRNSFTSAFKHFHGMTPSEFIKLQNKTLVAAKLSKH